MGASPRLWQGQDGKWGYEEFSFFPLPEDERCRRWSSWQQFMEKYGCEHKALEEHILFFWHWRRSDPEDYEEGEDGPPDTLLLKIYYMRNAGDIQHIINVSEDDEPEIRVWLVERAQALKNLWTPLF